MSAQGAADGVREKGLGSYNFHIIYFNYQKDPAKLGLMPGINLLFLDKGTEYKIAAMEGNLSRAFKYTGSPLLTFYEESNNAEGARMLLPLTRVQLGEPGTKIIFLAKDRNNRFVSSVIGAGTKDFKVDHVRVANFSRQVVKAKVGEQVADIKPMQSFDYPVQGESRRFLVRLAMAAMEDSEFNVFENRRFAVRQGGRKLIVVHQKTNSPDMLDYTSIIVEDQVPEENQSDEDVEALDPSKMFGPDSYSDGGE
jgi:hypothetical protein